MPEPLVTLSDLHVRYPPARHGQPPTPVLRDLHLTIQRGEILALIGRSGCGKTTLLNTLAGLTPHHHGHIERHDATLALVFQRPTLMPWMTTLDNALFGLRARNRRVTPHDRSRAEALLAQVGLEDHLHDHPHQLSQGMKQRVNLARALLTDPDLLLLDEPFSALDALTRRRLHDDLLALWSERQLTVLLVSHALEEVAYLADRVGLFTGQPAHIAPILTVDLPRPRAATPEARLDLYTFVEQLESHLG